MSLESASTKRLLVTTRTTRQQRILHVVKRCETHVGLSSWIAVLGVREGGCGGSFLGIYACLPFLRMTKGHGQLYYKVVKQRIPFLRNIYIYIYFFF